MADDAKMKTCWLCHGMGQINTQSGPGICYLCGAKGFLFDASAAITITDNPNTGGVQSVTLIPARPDCLSVSYGTVPHTYRPYVSLFSIGEDAEVTCDGKRVTIGELFAWLAEPRNVEVTLHPDPQRYGLSLKTEFRTTAGG